MTGTRILTQNALTGEWLSPALPLTAREYGDELNGPGSLSGKLSPRLVAQNPTLLDPGTTLIYVEEAGDLTWGGLVWDARPQGSEYAIEAASWSSYLMHRYDLDGELNGRGPYVYADRCKVIRDVWAYAQSITDGNLGVVVDSTTSTSTVGTPEDVLHSNRWDARALGDLVDDQVSADASPDYSCTVAWNADKTDAIRRIRLGWPRLGARRTDISFSSGVNIVTDPEIELAGDDYAQVVIGMGAGDGSEKRRQISAIRNGRLRLEYTASFPEAAGDDVLKSLTDAELAKRLKLGSLNEITIRDTPAAPFRSWQVGDDVYTRVYNPWVEFVGWRRITGWTIRPDATGGPQATISLQPADSYQYGGVS
ncbi:hypothetical protein HY68_36895 [Streptomyces sp. AcH 505]|uniref:hypothetical protein n=1 Tax=Streptomyces sp. AcH 505 TaxID=352211 RepID=UPI0005918E99|nr:hypothetical protein HY68_36895 [Streptomyces sp. AcH 505]